jgi:hypothetical protein
MEVRGQFHAPATLPPGERALVPIGQEIGWDPDVVWTLWSGEKSLAPAWNGIPAIYFFTISTELSQLQIKDRREEISYTTRTLLNCFNNEYDLSRSHNPLHVRCARMMCITISSTPRNIQPI